MELYRVYQGKIAECDREIETQLERFEDHSDGEPPDPNGKKRNQGNAPRFDVQGQLYRMTGVDLTRIDGVDGFTALKVVSEVGTDMTKWKSAKHFASWLGLSPNNRVTGGKVISSKTKPSANRAAAALRLAANALHRSDSALGAFLRRRKPTLERPRPLRPRRTSWPASSTPCCATGRSTWMPARNTMTANTAKGRFGRQNGGPCSSATSWFLLSDALVSAVPHASQVAPA